ncbi:hypothetical protein DAPPUDRAFT_314838 [Daphnia pulex]|uniref:Uncharacterized protein n=1 Tax=Daphnia pulex TaxID=6669 RepID=E9G7N4_DAPPU|nr:hypothetical protein DAPPUDRAFT_314838 [Daphnia pulex]|eukprot:EFX84505.1 hypothetical protein DAPPUDRAFT_314838 [Daphnia pulex]
MTTLKNRISPKDSKAPPLNGIPSAPALTRTKPMQLGSKHSRTISNIQLTETSKFKSLRAQKPNKPVRMFIDKINRTYNAIYDDTGNKNLSIKNDLLVKILLRGILKPIKNLMVLNQMLPEVTTWDDAQRAALRCETTLYKTQTSNGVLELPTFTSSNIDTLAATESRQKLKKTPSSTWDPINAEDHHNVTTTQTPSNDTAPKAETDNIQTLPTMDITNHSHRRHNNHTINAPKALPIDQIHQADLRVPTAGTMTLKIFNAIAVKILDTSLKNVGQKTPNDGATREINYKHKSYSLLRVPVVFHNISKFALIDTGASASFISDEYLATIPTNQSIMKSSTPRIESSEAQVEKPCESQACTI